MLTKIGRIIEHRTSAPRRVDLRSLKRGLNQNDDLLILIGADGRPEAVFDRICDHNGGRLFAIDKCVARCPLHGWELDVATGRYRNAGTSKSQIPYTVEGDFLCYDKTATTIALPESSSKAEPVHIRFINHAFLMVEAAGVRFLTDPWAVGPAFCTGWWLKGPSKSDWKAVANAADFIYVSHNHPDHLHFETLSHIDPAIPVLTGNFITGATERMLEEAGRKNVIAAEFGDAYRFTGSNLVLSVLKSGDFREDSGLIFDIGGFKGLLTVDSNNLNFANLPSPLTFLATSFASGASGYPLCFEMYSQDEKDRIVARNRHAVRTSIEGTIQKTRPRYYMPYAGFFAEYAARDSEIRTANRKNAIEDYAPICKTASATLLNVNTNDSYTFLGNDLVEQSALSAPPSPPEQPDDYIARFKKAYAGIQADTVLDYFRRSNYRDDLILFLHITDDDFSAAQAVFRIDFSQSPPAATAVSADAAAREFASEETLRVKEIRVRRESLLHVITHMLPWEDLLIGFQCRITRRPDIYNSEFWFHFTNVYVAPPSDKGHLIEAFAGAELFK